MPRLTIILTCIFLTAAIYHCSESPISGVLQGDDLPAQGLIAYYPFNGNADDASGKGHHGVLPKQRWVPDRQGNIARACYFNGQGAHIEVPHSGALNPVTGMSVSLWVKPEDVMHEWRTIVAKGQDNGMNLWAVQIHNGDGAPEGVVNFYNGHEDFPGSIIVDDSLWHHIVMTYDGASTWRVYVDNTLAIGATYGQCFTNDDLFIGGFEDDGGELQDDFGGAIDDVRLYSRVLSDSEIELLYSGGNDASLADGLVAHYPLDGNTSDATTNGHDGLLYEYDAVPVSIHDRFGTANAAYQFSGGHIPVLLTPELRTDVISICAWIMITQPGNDWLDIVSYGGGGHVIAVDRTAEFLGGMQFTSSETCEFNATSRLNTDEWRFVVMTRDSADTIRLYVDGTLEQQQKCLKNPVYAFPEIHIGGCPEAADEDFDGSIDDVRIYNRPLSADEIIDLYQEQGWTAK